MAKLRLLVWTVATGVAAVVLLGDVGWSVDDPAVALMAIVRVVAGALAAYLFVATLLALRVPRLAPRFVRHLVATAVGAGLLVAPLTASASTRDPAPIEAPVLRRVPAPEPAPAAPGSGDVSTPDVASSHHQNAVVTIVAGDHLWGIAERTLTTRLGRSPSDAEIVPFWTAVIELNRDQLADPDLIFAGQEIRLPS